MCSRRGVRADNGRLKGEGGGGITRPIGADAETDPARFLPALTPSDEAFEDERLLDLELFVRGDSDREDSTGADAVDVNEAEEAEVEVVATESVEGFEVRAGFSKVKWVPVGNGVISAGDSFERKSR